LLAIALENLGYMALVVLGVGFLIFVHELGHFLAARAAGVRVEVFSIGFGTRLFGWRDSKQTDWRICLLPIGGYVKMYGEAPGEGEEGDEDSLGSKSVGWRFLVFSGGVIMNVIFAAIAFPIVFGVGISFPAPVAGDVAPGSPAAVAGIQKGDRIVSIDGAEIHSFETLQTEGALSGEEGLRLGIRRETPEGPEDFEVEVHPRYDPSLGLKLIGIQRPTENELKADELRPDGPAAAAGLPAGSTLLSMNGTPLDPETWLDQMRELRGDKASSFVQREVEFGYRDADGIEGTVRFRPELDPGSPVLGVIAPQNAISQILDREALHGLDLQEGDIVVELQKAGQRHFVPGPEQLLELLKEPGPAPIQLGLRRSNEPGGELGSARVLLLDVPAELQGAGATALRDQVIWAIASARSNYVRVQPGSAAAEAGLRTGDRVIGLRGAPVGTFGQLATIVRAADGNELAVEWLPFHGEGDATPAPRKAKITPRSVPVVDFGFVAFRDPLREIYQVDGIGASMLAGRSTAWTPSVASTRRSSASSVFGRGR
jgi:regulator of sigma E protease